MNKLALAVCAVVCVCSGSPAAAAASPADVYTAIRTNDLARLRTLIASREDANAPGEFGQPPLLAAAVAGSVDAMRLLLDTGADVNAQNPFGSTALMLSATQMPKVQLLLDRGAN